MERKENLRRSGFLNGEEREPSTIRAPGWRGKSTDTGRGMEKKEQSY
jgi:hypothetical protein